MPEREAGGRLHGCPDVETLAAFVDGRLPATVRAGVVEHLAGCEGCYELVAELMHAQNELSDERLGGRAVATVEPLRARGASSRRRTFLVRGGAFVAVAASLLLFVFNSRSVLDPLVSSVGEQRLTVVRPTGGFRYGPLRSPLRGGREDGNLAIATEAARLRERATSGDPEDAHAWGVAQLITGDAAASMETLQPLLASASDGAVYHADYGAAALAVYLEDRRPEGAARALDALDRATALDPSLKEAWFNKALLLDALGHEADALVTWNRYLELDRSSAWAEEARRRRDQLAAGVAR